MRIEEAFQRQSAVLDGATGAEGRCPEVAAEGLVGREPGVPGSCPEESGWERHPPVLWRPR